MTPEDLKIRGLEKELQFSASRSTGAGGQNVNKVNTKVELRFSVISTLIFSDEEKELIINKLKNRLNNDGELVLVCQEARSQLANKLAVTEKFYRLLASALTLPLPRKETRPTKASKIKRLESKKFRSTVKKFRRSDSISGEE